MANEYELRRNDGILDGLGYATPHHYEVVDAETGETRGTVAGWDADSAGQNIAEGDWHPNS